MVCKACKKTAADAGYKTCTSCREKRRVISLRQLHKVYKNQLEIDKLNAKKRAAAAVKRAERIKKGICTRCGKQPQDKPSRSCKQCKEKIKMQKIKSGKDVRDRENYKRIHNYRIENNLCSMCGSKRDRENRKICTSCRDKAKLREIKRYLRERARNEDK